MRRRLRRRRRGNQSTVSLFSFIDVIGGMIGALSLIIICVSLSHVIPESTSASPLSSQKRLAEIQIKQKNAQIDRIRETISEISRQQADMQKVRLKLVTLRQNVNQMTDRQSYVAEALKEKQALHKRINELETKETIINRIISTSDKFHLLLERVKERPGGTVIFLIRPDGIRSFNLALTRASKYKVRSGKLPVPGSGEIDLSHYKE